MNDAPQPTNPYPRAIFSQRQWDLVSDAMAGYAQVLQQQGDPESLQKVEILRDLLGRTNQIVHAGQGMSADTAERYRKRLETALRSKDPGQVAAAYKDFFAASIRLDPDPAGFIADMTVQLIGQAQALTAVQAAAETLLGPTGVLGELSALATSLEAGTWTPTAPELLDYLTKWVDAGLENAKQGLTPWPKDEAPAEGATT